MDTYRVIKVINNSAIMVCHQEEEIILLGKGIGFQKKEGDVISESKNIEKKYQLIHAIQSNPKQNNVSIELLPFIATVIEVMDASTLHMVSFTTLKSLADHIAAMYQRIVNQETLANPFHFETKSLYSKEYQIGLAVGEEVFRRTGLMIPESEIDFLTLYIRYVNTKEEKSTTDLIHNIIYQVSCLLSDTYQIVLEKDSIDYSRFVVHLRFVIERVMRNEKPVDINLKGIFLDHFQQYDMICADIIKILQEELHTVISDDERMYLLLHMARLNTLSVSS